MSVTAIINRVCESHGIQRWALRSKWPRFSAAKQAIAVACIERGCSIAETAKAMGVNRDTVRHHYRRWCETWGHKWNRRPTPTESEAT